MDFMQSHGRVAEALPPTPSTSTTSSPLRGSGKRKAQPRKRIIDDEMDQPFFTGGGLPDASASAATSEDMAATAIVKEVKREMDEDAASGLDEMFGRRNQMRSCNGGGGSPSSMTSVDAENLLHRLSSIIGMPSMQELLAGQVSSSSSSMGAATLQAALSNHASASDPLLAQFAGGNALFTTPVRSAATGSASVPLIKGERTSSSGTPTSSGEGPSPSSPVDHGMLLNAAAVAAVVAARNGRGGGVPPGPGAAPIKVIPAIPDAMRTQSTRTLTLKRKLFNNNTEALKAAARAISTEERIDLDDLEQFAQVFKKQRIKFGFTQGDVGQALGRRYGTDFSQTTISRFEALNLSFKNMCKLRPLLKEWLTEAERAVAAGANPTDLLRQSASVQASLAPAAATAVAKADGGGGVMRQACPSLSDYLAGSNGASGGVMAMGGGHHGQPPLKKRRKRTNLDTIQKTQLDTEFEANPRPTHTRMVEIADALELDRDVVRVWFCNRRQKVRKQEDERLSMASVMGYSFAAAAAAAQGFGDPTQMQSLDDGEDDEEEEDDVEENLLIPPPVLDPLPPSNGDQQKAPPLGQ